MTVFKIEISAILKKGYFFITIVGNFKIDKNIVMSIILRISRKSSTLIICSFTATIF